jgi:hypothetical protein
MTEPVPVGELLPAVVAEAIERAGPGYDRWAEQVAATGYCAHPVRLRAALSTPTWLPARSGLCTRPTASPTPPS